MTGTVRIGEHSYTLPDDEARELGEAAMRTATGRGGWLSPDNDTLIAVTPSTPISITITGEFTEENVPNAKPKHILNRTQQPRQARIW
ncbi:hypothetical protein [Microbacterium sufflavum]|uniref:Uncharacterized protein n=1 Tax=Microbacterium sufflavum TaxID=2851649 RepID=A0ABY4IB37_9MICO|nr:hypothetical protein [Microbacterium sufflavum]UPL09979.1 hypothetical protein KV394_02140 [Microbacterium sufflavum]